MSNPLAMFLVLAVFTAVARAADTPYKITPIVPTEAHTFSHDEVVLLDGPFKHAQNVGTQYLLDLDPDRLLAPFYEVLKLPPKKPRYGGWEAAGVAGHMLGHWLSGASRIIAETHHAELSKRLDYIISELALLQSKRPDGYIAGFPSTPLDKVFTGTFEVQSFSLGGHWVPWYTLHKLFAGLLDTYTITGNKQALDIAIKLADFAKAGTDKLNEEQFQRMLQCEHGGMNESMAELYALTGDKRYLDLAQRFIHKAIFDPLAAQRDQLTGIHANTQIPKIVGAARLYELTGNDYYKNASHYFFDEVITKRSYAFGGNSIAEHFPKLGAEPLGPNTAETCNTYNMLRLDKQLMQQHPLARYGDYYERALYNQILATQDPDTGTVEYFLSTKPGHFKVYGTAFDSMWCCTGTGIENPGRYAEAAYFHSDDTLFVNLYLPTELRWTTKSFSLRQETKFPDAPSTRFTITGAPASEISIKLRIPYWAAGPVVVSLNGKELVRSGDDTKDGWLTIRRKWSQGDALDISLPMDLHLYKSPDDPHNVAILYGPIVLAAQMGRENFPADDHFIDQNSPNFLPAPPAPILVSEKTDPSAWLTPVEGKPLTFKTAAAKPADVTLIPLFRLHHERYTIYFPVMTADAYAAHAKDLRETELAQRELDKRTIDLLIPGQQQPDLDHKFAGEHTSNGTAFGRSYRHADSGGWFSYQLKSDPAAPLVLRATYWGTDAGRREFDILVDKQVIATQKLNNTHPNDFFDADYAVPESLTKGKSTIEVKFQAHADNIAGGLYGLRVLRR